MAKVIYGIGFGGNLFMEEQERVGRTEANTEKKENRKKDLLIWLKDFAIAIVIAFLVVQVVKPTIVKQTSMEPNFHSNDYLFIYKLAYKLGNEPDRGDVIVFKSNLKTDTGDHKLLIKRVIGKPGDKILIQDGKVYINDKENDQSFTKDNHTYGFVDTVVPKGKVFVLGDNRDVSEDSRSEFVGMVPEKDIIGKVIIKIFPLSDFGLIKNPYNK